MLDNGTRVKIVVPLGVNAGEVTAYGVIVGRIMGGIDGNRYLVKEKDGSINEHCASWIKRD